MDKTINKIDKAIRRFKYVFKYSVEGFPAVIASYVSSHPEIKEAPKVIKNYMQNNVTKKL